MRAMTFAAVVALAAAATACFGSPSDVFAPRYPGAARAPKSPEQVQILKIGRPSCEYAVIGTVFTRGEGDFPRAAAAVGGDGVYDSQCDLNVVAGALSGPASECAARVFICTSPAKGGR